MEIAICDDEQKDIEIMLAHCQSCNINYNITVFSSAKELLNAFSKQFYDLIFLDIEMAEPNGYKIGKILSKRVPCPLIIFTTNSNQYAVRGYGIAFRYLCKPIEFQAFRDVYYEALPYLFPKKEILTFNGQQISVSTDDIYYFESIKHHVIFHMKNNKTIEIKDLMAHTVEKFNYPNFFQIHRSFCINLEYVDYIKSSNVVMTNGTEIPISRKKQDEFQKRFIVFAKTSKSFFL